MTANITFMYTRFVIRLACCFVLLGAGWVWPLMATAQQIVINELDDIDFGRAAPTGGRLQADIRFCVVLDQQALYRVLAYGDEVGGEFNLRSGPYRMPYRVRYTDRRRARGFQTMYPGQYLTGLRTRGNNNGICRRPNARVRVVLPAGSLSQAPSGSYRSTLTLMVSPE